MLTRSMTWRVAIVAAWFATGGATAWAQGASPTLRGTVTSDREGPMEGVLVSARRQGSPITVTVVSNAKGRGPWLPGETSWENKNFDQNFVVEI